MRTELPGRILPALWLVLAVAWAPGAVAAGPPGYVDAYGRLLERHTRAVRSKVGTRVDYAALKEDPAWRAMVSELGEVSPESLTGRADRLAFWINAYNILAIDLVLQSYPVASIKDIGSIFRSVWKREAGRIGGRGYSLDEIEHEILRPMGEPRIHAAIVCASISCPNLLREPYVADRLGEQLDASARAWLMRPEKGLLVDREDDAVRLSPIFDWFEEDFGGQDGVLDFVASHADPADGEFIRSRDGRLSVSYFDYDWGLNDYGPGP